MKKGWYQIDMGKHGLVDDLYHWADPATRQSACGWTGKLVVSEYHSYSQRRKRRCPACEARRSP